MEKVTHGKMNSKVRGSFLSLEGNKKNLVGKGEEKENEKERKKEKEVTTLPFAISDEPTIETHRGKRQSWSMRQELHVGTKNCEFCCIPKGKGFSYTGYFLPSIHVRAILVQL